MSIPIATIATAALRVTDLIIASPTSLAPAILPLRTHGWSLKSPTSPPRPHFIQALPHRHIAALPHCRIALRHCRVAALPHCRITTWQ
jgi:hypothetical protein